jgi:hypothetical protein
VSNSFHSSSRNILIAAAVLLLGIGIFVFKQISRSENLFGPIPVTQAQLNLLKQELNDFRRICGAYPTTAQGLNSLREKPKDLNCPNFRVLNDAPLPTGAWQEDAWHIPFAYESDGTRFRLQATHDLRVEGP